MIYRKVQDNFVNVLLLLTNVQLHILEKSRYVHVSKTSSPWLQFSTPQPADEQERKFVVLVAQLVESIKIGISVSDHPFEELEYEPPL